MNMTIYTSYYSNRHLPEGAFLVQVSTSKPDGVTVDAVWRTVFPDYRLMVAPIKAGEIDEDEYKRRYLARLEAVADEITRELFRLAKQAENRPLVLLCYCARGKFCHRHLLAEFLTGKIEGLVVEEYEEPVPPETGTLDFSFDED